MPATDSMTPAYRIDMQSEFSPTIRSGLSADIESITQPDDFMVKEHFEDFRRRFTDTNKQLVGRVFNRLIDDVYKPYVRTPLNADEEPRPYPGITLASREKAGFEPYPQRPGSTDYRSLRLANFAIRADSLISTEATLKQRKDGPLFQIFTLSLIDKLKKQIDT